jgi:transcriptional regulator with XRE-family HTH domain
MTAKPEATSSPADLLSKRLREAREFLNLSQQFVADQTGLPRSAVSDIERGGRRVDSLELKRFAALYRMPVEYFLGSNEYDSAGEIDPTVAALARTASDLSPDEKQEVLRFALFLQNYQRRPADSA